MRRHRRSKTVTHYDVMMQSDPWQVFLCSISLYVEKVQKVSLLFEQTKPPTPSARLFVLPLRYMRTFTRRVLGKPQNWKSKFRHLDFEFAEAVDEIGAYPFNIARDMHAHPAFVHLLEQDTQLQLC